MTSFTCKAYDRNDRKAETVIFEQTIDARNKTEASSQFQRNMLAALGTDRATQLYYKISE